MTIPSRNINWEGMVPNPRTMAPLKPSKLRLRFVHLESLLLHEEFDPYRVQRLEIVLRKDGWLRNPPIVASHGQSFVVLDGATRVSALRKMGCRDALVQIVDYDAEHVGLDSWCHVIVGLKINRLLTEVNQIKELMVKRLNDEETSPWRQSRQAFVRIVAKDGREFAVFVEGDVCQQALNLCQFVHIYKGKAEVHRTIDIDIPTLLEEYPDLNAAVAFPNFTPADIVEIAMNGGRLPMGISRHIIAGRALGLNIPLKHFKDTKPIEDKNAWLKKRIRKRLRQNKVRLYLEPVFIFDE